MLRMIIVLQKPDIPIYLLVVRIICKRLKGEKGDPRWLHFALKENNLFFVHLSLCQMTIQIIFWHKDINGQEYE